MGKEGTPLFAFAEVFDPTFEDLVEPYGLSPADGDPLEDGLSVPVGVDPATRVTAVVALHSFPGQDQIVLPRTLHTTGLPEGFGLGEGTQRLATACEAGSVCVRGPGTSWRARRDLCVRPGQSPATVSAGQVRHLRAPRRASGRAMRSTPCRPPRSSRTGGPRVAHPARAHGLGPELCRAKGETREFVAVQGRITPQEPALIRPWPSLRDVRRGERSGPVGGGF
jgi:hypothetical protein